MSLYRVEAIILKARNFGEADKILTLFTREHGKVEAVARGVRKIKSKNRGSVQPFSRSSIMLYKGKNLDTVTQCDLLEGFPGLRNDLDLLAYAGYLAELTDLMLPERERNEEIYVLLLTTFHLLAHSRALSASDSPGSGDIELIARQFEVRLLSLTGYQPQLESCVFCNNALHEGELRFSPGLGGILCSGCKSNDMQALLIGRGTIAIWKYLTKINLRNLNRLRLGAQERAQLEAIIHCYIENILERRVKTMDFVKGLKRLAPTDDAG
jgi:DNA repair protein RecO (recombination protein O)